ncbi:MAG TPA: aminoacyl-tRNA hydrolase [Afifellaceae bacterium]|nr:aminoacyl-tRNA hydrolase [Afifellaceae bacterium]
MLLIVGLGNPGRRYAGNRHNIGFMAADAIHRRHGFAAWRARFQGEICEGRLDGERTVLLKPATFMNESGRAVGEAMRFFKLSPADLLVIYDELDLPPGKVRMKTGGGAGGHKGIRSITAHVGENFRRMRLGIGHPGAKELVNSYVLHDFAKVDHDWRDAVLTAVADNAPLLAKAEDSSFMNKVHLDLLATGLFDGDEAENEVPDKPRVQATAKPAGPAASHQTGALAAGLKKLFGRRPR